MKRRALRRRYGRSSAAAASLFAEIESVFRSGRASLAAGDVEGARASVLRIGALSLKANDLGLDPKKYGVALRAQRILIDGLSDRRAA
jgi:hypothetical protein